MFSVPCGLRSSTLIPVFPDRYFTVLLRSWELSLPGSQLGRPRVEGLTELHCGRAACLTGDTVLTPQGHLLVGKNNSLGF